MNKKDLIDFVALEENKSKKDAKAFVDTFLTNVVKSIEMYGSLTIRNFGTFSLVKRAARKGRNPQTGEELLIPEKTVLKFKAAKELKEEVKTIELE